MYYVPRGGNRGGADQFKWEDVKDDKGRECYLGHSLMAPVGRWQKNKDLQWFCKDNEDKPKTPNISSEIQAARNAEREAMLIALGQKVGDRLAAETMQPQKEVSLRQLERSTPDKKKKKKKKLKEKRNKRDKDNQKKQNHKKRKRRRRDSSESESSSDSESSESSSEDERDAPTKRRKDHRDDHHRDDHHRGRRENDKNHRDGLRKNSRESDQRRRDHSRERCRKKYYDKR